MKQKEREQIERLCRNFLAKSPNKEEKGSAEAIDNLIDNLSDSLRAFVTTGETTENELIECVTPLLPKEHMDMLLERLQWDLEPFNELAFLREMNEERQMGILVSVYNNMIVHQFDYYELQEKLSLSEDQFMVVSKLLNTLMRYIIDMRFSAKYAEKWTREMTGFSLSMSKALVNMYAENRSIFEYILMSRRLTQLERKLDPIVSFMEEVIKNTESNDGA